METLPLATGPQPGDVAASRNDIIYFDVSLQVLPSERRRNKDRIRNQRSPVFKAVVLPQHCSVKPVVFMVQTLVSKLVAGVSDILV